MKLLILSHTGDILGGAEMSMLDVCDVLTKKYGVEVEFIVREPVRGMSGEMRRRGWKFTSLPYTFWSDGNPPVTKEAIARNAKLNLDAVEKIEKIITKSNPDIVITNSIVCPWAAIAAYKLQRPHVWFIREYGDIDHGRTFTLGREMTMEDIDKTTNLIITISEALKTHLDKYIDPKKIQILYNPFKVEEIKKSAQKKVASPYKYKQSLKLAISGNIAPTKGQLEAIQAVGSLTDKGYKVELCVVGRQGDPEFMQKIQSTIEAHKINNRVHLVGFKKDLLAYLRHADVGIMASRMEGFGRVTFEYLLLGKPVVGANSGATPELVIDGQCGYLYKLGSPQSLEESIEYYLKNPALIKRHSKAAKRRAKDIVGGEYSIDKTYGYIKSVAETVRHKTNSGSLNIVKQLEKDAKLVKGVKLKSFMYDKTKRLYHKSRTIKARVIGK